jgi:hypothetical protein
MIVLGVKTYESSFFRYDHLAHCISRLLADQPGKQTSFSVD